MVHMSVIPLGIHVGKHSSINWFTEFMASETTGCWKRSASWSRRNCYTHKPPECDPAPSAQVDSRISWFPDRSHLHTAASKPLNIRDTYSIDLLCYKHVLFSRYEKLKPECFYPSAVNFCRAAEWEVDPGVLVLQGISYMLKGNSQKRISRDPASVIRLVMLNKKPAASQKNLSYFHVFSHTARVSWSAV